MLIAQTADIAGVMYFINVRALRQHFTPGRLLGRVNAGFQALEALCAIVGAIVGGFIAEHFSTRFAIGLGIAIIFTSALWLWRSAISTVRTLADSSA